MQCYNWWKKLFFDHPVKSDMRTYDNIRKNGTGQGDDYITVGLLDYIYLKITDYSNRFT